MANAVVPDNIVVTIRHVAMMAKNEFWNPKIA